MSEWEAFERAYGPIDGEYSADMLAQIHEQLQILTWLMGNQFEPNPAPKPRNVPRPPDIYVEQEDEEGMTVAEFNEQFD